MIDVMNIFKYMLSNRGRKHSDRTNGKACIRVNSINLINLIIHMP